MNILAPKLAALQISSPKNKMAIFSKMTVTVLTKFQQFMGIIDLNDSSHVVSLERHLQAH
jgi:hypothetical protein